MNEELILGIELVLDEKISRITTYHTKGVVKGVFYPKNEREFINIVKFLNFQHFEYKIIGNGSNFLISHNCKLFFISTKKLEKRMKINKNIVHFSASVPLAMAQNFCASHKLGGFEALTGIPATIGGAIKMNASAFGTSIFDHIDKIKIFSHGKIIKIDKSKINYGYHNTNLNDTVILSASFKLDYKSSCEIKREISKYVVYRKAHQPREFSCGCVFRNPPLYSAGKLIELCGLKGTRIGDAEISTVHGNFIINHGNASFNDVKTLIELCENEVYKKFRIKLEREVEIIE